MVSESLIRQITKVSRQDIELANNHKGAIIWLTGLSGSGKSSIAIETEVKLFQSKHKVFILDR